MKSLLLSKNQFVSLQVLLLLSFLPSSRVCDYPEGEVQNWKKKKKLPQCTTTKLCAVSVSFGGKMDLVHDGKLNFG